MSYTDKELQLATQIAYMKISEGTIQNYYKQNGKYPTMQELLTVNKANQLFNRTETKHWWITGFKWGELCEDPNELTMNVSITFPTMEMRDAFLDGGTEYSNGTADDFMSDDDNNNDNNGIYGIRNLGYTPVVNGLTVSFVVKNPYTQQPFT